MSDLPAGRQLDALVAEKVMGYVWRTAGTEESFGRLLVESPISLPMASMTEPSNGVEPLRIDAFGSVLSYSTNIAAAWLVVEKLIADGWFIDMTHEGTWRVRLTKHFPMKRGKWQPSLEPEAVLDVSLPLAICRAALKAVAA